jgi:spermidine synthase
MTTRVWKIALLLFGSGACALVYQTVWLRELRLVFGASTAASAAVLAIFMGGLGAGGLFLGRRADRHPRPLAFYGRLELLIALTAAVTPALLWLVREAYVAAGGSWSLGAAPGSLARLLLSALVLAAPTLLMGGTLPAAARSAETDEDSGRRGLALLYGANTLGAVAGTVASTFFLLEALGNRATLWLACAANVAVAALAVRMAGAPPAQETQPGPPALETDTPPTAAPRAFVLAASAIAGFAFLLMELVWYRMLGPLLGGSTFTFGLILATALLGIGVGGAAYALLGGRRPATLGALALTCAAEAAFVALPFALGDRVAVLALVLRALGELGFYGLVLGWAVVTSIVVLPAAIAAGVQFPLLIALLGRGRERVGHHVGLAYAWNTAGAIAGSLAGGFGLLPGLTAPGAWRGVAVALALLGLWSLALAVRQRQPGLRLPAAAAAAAALVMLTAAGPTAMWRHTPIGAGRAQAGDLSRNGLRDLVNYRRRVLQWEAEGVESSVALCAENGLAFLVNGKVDGHARGDAGTQVMSGVLGAILHPSPKRALVVGLGTGSTAGWLGAVPSVERVDVVELEPAIAEVARACSPVNLDVLSNPKVRVANGDGREALLVVQERYDLIISEPSNPYRAGVASLFTREYYRAAAERLAEGGLFLQWMQAYEVDAETIRTAYATLASAFPHVETWQTQPGDLLLVASARPIAYDPGALRARIRREPVRAALANAWRATDLEGVLARYVGGAGLTEAMAGADDAAVNTDDRNRIEFAFARSVGQPMDFDVRELRAAARAAAADRPKLAGGAVDWASVEDQRVSIATVVGVAPLPEPDFWPDQWNRAEAQVSYAAGELKDVLTFWRSQPRQPATLVELAMVAEALADAGDEAALGLAERLRAFQPAEADAVLARLRWRQGRYGEAAAALEACFARYRVDPWPSQPLMWRALAVAVAVAREDPSTDSARRLYHALEEPFSVLLANERRLEAAFEIAARVPPGGPGESPAVRAVDAFGPYIPWRRAFLAERFERYREAGDPRAGAARRDLEAFLEGERAWLAALLPDRSPVRVQ